MVTNRKITYVVAHINGSLVVTNRDFPTREQAEGLRLRLLAKLDKIDPDRAHLDASPDRLVVRETTDHDRREIARVRDEDDEDPP